MDKKEGALTYYYDKSPSRTTYDVRMGLIYIAHIFCPDLRSGRTDFTVRLKFNQDVGKVDYSKDKNFDTLDQCKEYIQSEFKKFIKEIGYNLGLWKNRTNH